jgi:hypothetical protein
MENAQFLHGPPFGTMNEQKLGDAHKVLNSHVIEF